MYNKRGAIERDFDRLNNDFGWKHLPCSFLKENTVYMILTDFCMNFFTYFIRAVSSVFTGLSPTWTHAQFAIGEKISLVHILSIFEDFRAF